MFHKLLKATISPSSCLVSALHLHLLGDGIFLQRPVEGWPGGGVRVLGQGAEQGLLALGAAVVAWWVPAYVCGLFSFKFFQCFFLLTHFEVVLVLLAPAPRAERHLGDVAAAG